MSSHQVWNSYSFMFLDLKFDLVHCFMSGKEEIIVTSGIDDQVPFQFYGVGLNF